MPAITKAGDQSQPTVFDLIIVAPVRGDLPREPRNQ